MSSQENGESAVPEEESTAKPAESRALRSLTTGEEQILSSEASLHGRELAKKAELKRIRKAGVRHEGRKVITDDVKILKSIAELPDEPEDPVNFYREPVRIEYYIPKESRFAVETRHLFIPLIDPEPKEEYELLKRHISEDRFFDLIRVMDEEPRYITEILDSYNTLLPIYESLSRYIRDAEENPESYKSAFYLVETLSEYEPTMAALELLGPFMAWNLNWLVRALNRNGVDFAASDKTVSYFIKQRNIFNDEHQIPYDERFEVLAALFYEQAFPNRGMEFGEEDFFYDIFEKRKI